MRNGVWNQKFGGNVIFLSKVAETVKAKLCVFCFRLSMHIVNGKIHYEERYATLLAGRAC